jgi:hypothetical protein
MTIVEHWFGSQFQRLHPHLQALHTHGGRLRGDVHVRFGKRGLAKWLGCWLATALGVPLNKPLCPFWVDIQHQSDHMQWARYFAGRPVVSQFKPVGFLEESGYWEERKGWLSMRLGVDVVNSGWYWRLHSLRWAGIPLPLPQVKAFKRIEGEGRYRFAVEISVPKLGLLFAYNGVLRLVQPS